MAALMTVAMEAANAAANAAVFDADHMDALRTQSDHMIAALEVRTGFILKGNCIAVDVLGLGRVAVPRSHVGSNGRLVTCKEAYGGSLAPSRLHQHVQHLNLVAHHMPSLMPLARDRDGHLVEV